MKETRFCETQRGKKMKMPQYQDGYHIVQLSQLVRESTIYLKMK